MWIAAVQSLAGKDWMGGRGWSLSQLSLGERQGTPLTGRQSITGPLRHKQDKQPAMLTLMLTPRVNLESPMNLTCFFGGGSGKKPEYPERTHTYTGRTCKHATWKLQLLFIWSACCTILCCAEWFMHFCRSRKKSLLVSYKKTWQPLNSHFWKMEVFSFFHVTQWKHYFHIKMTQHQLGRKLQRLNVSCWECR